MCKLFGYLECKKNKWDCEEKGKGRCFQKGKVAKEWEVLWCGMNGIITGIQEIERAREGLAVLMKDEWHSAVINFECVKSRALSVKFNLSRIITSGGGVWFH